MISSLIGILGLLLVIAAFVFWIMMLVDAIKREDGPNKIVWVIVIVFLHFLGALIYFFARKSQR